MCRNFVSLSLMVLVSLVAAPAFGATLTYNFDGADSPGTWAALTGYAGDSNCALDVRNYGDGYGYGAQSGTYYVMGGPSGNPKGCWNGDQATATFASPTFKLDGSGDLTFWVNTGNRSTLNGRTIAGGSVVPGSGGVPLSSLPATSADAGGFYGVALLDVTSSTIVMGGTNDRALDWRNNEASAWNARQTSGFSRLGDGWWQLRFRDTDLAGLNQSHVYRVAFIDQWYSWGEFDSVRIPGVLYEIPEPSTLALLAAGLIGLLCYAWRKRR